MEQTVKFLVEIKKEKFEAYKKEVIGKLKGNLKKEKIADEFVLSSYMENFMSGLRPYEVYILEGKKVA